MDELQVEVMEVPGFPNYRVKSDGTVWSNFRNTRQSKNKDGWHEIRGGLDKDGYRKLILCNRSIRKYVRAHCIVLRCFAGPPPADMIHPTAAHNNGDKTDNRLSNLRWASQRDNIQDKRKHGTWQCGEASGTSILTESIVRHIRELRSSGETYAAIAKRFQVSTSAVNAACNRRNWKHVV